MSKIMKIKFSIEQADFIKSYAHKVYGFGSYYYAINESFYKEIGLDNVFELIPIKDLPKEVIDSLYVNKDNIIGDLVSIDQIIDTLSISEDNKTTLQLLIINIMRKLDNYEKS
jgi:hypothetical protein